MGLYQSGQRHDPRQCKNDSGKGLLRRRDYLPDHCEWLRTIEKNAFQGCADLLGTEITIPASVTTLASGAFSELFTTNAEGKVDGSKSLTVKVMNPDLVLAEATGDYQYFSADDTGHTNPSYTGDAFAVCVNLILYAPAGASTAKAYADKFNGVIIQATKENINFWYFPRTAEFRELTDVPVYHTVTLPDGGLRHDLHRQAEWQDADSRFQWGVFGGAW